MSELPLHGIRVLDLTRLAPGPFASLVLADLGAEVIKIEQPDRGDPLRYLMRNHKDDRSLLFELLNRNKKSVALDLKASRGKALMLELVRTADVLLEGFRPGVMQRLDLEHETLLDINEGLIYVSISGYGQNGPYRERAGHDVNYLALAGLLGLTGTANGPPVIPGVPVADLVSGLWAALWTLAALLRRQYSGRGAYLDLSLLDSVAALLAVPVGEWLATGLLPQRGQMTLGGGQACYNVYETADGLYMTLGAVEPYFWQAFCTAVGRKDWMARQHDTDQQGLTAEVAALFQSQPRAHWIKVFAAHDCCCEPVLALDEALAHPQMVHRAMVCGDSVATPLARQGVRRSPAPKLGAHTEVILAELGYSERDVQLLREQGVV